MNNNIDQLLAEIESLKLNNKKLENQVVELKGRTGLVWKDQPEHFIKTLADGDVIYGQSRYKVAGKRNKSNGKKVTVVLNDDVCSGMSSIEMLRLSDSYLYRLSDPKKAPVEIADKQFLIHGETVYIKVCEDLGTYIPKLIKKGDKFGFDDKNGDRNNVLIEGDNYHALQVLQHTHKGKIDVIYIDPPYNTGNKDFKYNDNFVSDEAGDRHSSWLSFMKKRLELSKNLLSESGIGFISIDYNELSRLNILTEQVFGKDNVLDIFSWVRTDTPSNLSSHTRKVTEYIILFCKNKIKAVKLKAEIVDGSQTQPLIKKSNAKKELEFKPGTVSFKIKDGIIKSGIKTSTKLSNDIEVKDYKNINTFKIENGFVWTQKKLDEEINAGTQILINTNDINPRFKRFIDNNYKSPKNLLNKDVGVGVNEDGTKEIKKLLGRSDLIYPKPKSLIKYLINLTKSKDVKVLDFFAGTGTTAHATWELNKEDGGNRKCILVTNNENNICEDVTYERLRRCNLPEHGDYQEGLEYVKIEHVSVNEVCGKVDEHNIDFTRQIASLMFNSYKMIDDNEHWFATNKFAVLLNWKKRDDFFAQFKDHEHIALLTHRPRKYDDFFDLAIKHNFKQEQLHHFTQDYVEEMKAILERQEVSDNENLQRILKEQEK